MRSLLLGALLAGCAPAPRRATVRSQIYEGADRHGGWDDLDGPTANYFCSNGRTEWSESGPKPGMRCTQIYEHADPDAWDDDYLCVREAQAGGLGSAYHFRWSEAGPIPSHEGRCIRWHEPDDPNAWSDNYLCW